MGRSPLIVSRGYGSAEGQPNEEALELQRLAPGAAVVQRRNRWKAISDWTWHNPCGLAILDDGFQHRRLARDLDIVLVDALNPFGYGRLLPRGLLREPLSALRRADMAVITRAELIDATALTDLKRNLAACLRPETPVLVARNRPTGLRLADDSLRDVSSLGGRTVAAACGIGNPEAFRRTLEQAGAAVRLFEIFPDHYAYTAADLALLLSAARTAGVKMLVTTGKDYVKWRPLLVGATAGRVAADVEVAALEVAFEIVEGADVLRRRIAALCRPEDACGGAGK
jgi:tetraacyldisaccharide 4'-kinase